MNENAKNTGTCMKHMLKVLLIAIVGLFVGNVKATTQAQQLAQPKTAFDLPPTEVYDLGEQIKVNGMLKCLLKNNYVIEFPLDGHQPTTEEAVKYSCANVDNGEDSPITEWYMKMFGVIDKSGGNSDNNDDYIKAGYDKTNIAFKIIDISSLLSTDDQKELPKRYDSQKDAFVKNFRKIASTSVGRVLLYRILLEIRRTNGGDGSQGEDIESTLLKNDVKLRNNLRHISIKWSTLSNKFCWSGDINFGVNSPLLRATTVLKDPKPINGRSIYKILNYPKTDDVGLFHEMIHWYHCLRDIKRIIIENTAHNGLVNLHGTNVVKNTNEVPFANHYWPGHSSVDWKGSALPWVGKFGDCLVVNFEEIRTILGVPMNCPAYKNGDDLSENLYRSCCKQPLRFGHSRSAFFEDRDVVSKVQQAIPVGIYHGIENVHFIEDEKVCPPPTFEYVNTHLVQGINGCRVPVLGVDCIK